LRSREATWARPPNVGLRLAVTLEVRSDSISRDRFHGSAHSLAARAKHDCGGASLCAETFDADQLA
jgi:hypothetical protein